MEDDRNRNGNRVRLFLLGIAATSIGVLTFLLSCTAFRNWIIIGFGVRALSTVYITELVATGVGFGFTVVRSIPLLKIRALKQREKERQLEQRKQQSQVLINYSENSENPEYTRKRLHYLRSEMPGLDNLVIRCLDQMDRMDALQAKQAVLIESNGASYLKETVAVFDNVERRICLNFRNIINLCIAADSSDNLDMKKIEQNLTDNEKKLADTQKLLKASADWINQYNQSNKDDRSEVENWITVIRDSLKED